MGKEGEKGCKRVGKREREREAINPEALKIHASAEQRMMGKKITIKGK